MAIKYFKKDNRVHNTFHNHTYEPNIIDSNGWALDLGCNDFIMTKHLLSKGLKVIAIDPIKTINIPQDILNNPNFTYLQKACVGIKKEQTVRYYEYSHWGANSIVNTPDKLHSPENHGHGNNPFKESYDVDAITIQELMNEYKIEQFEFIKIDIEGAEYDILENLPKKCTKQMSIEFHAFLGLTPIKDVEEYHKFLTEKLEDYFVSYEQLEPLKRNPEYWDRNDTLYVLKDLE